MRLAIILDGACEERWPVVAGKCEYNISGFDEIRVEPDGIGSFNVPLIAEAIACGLLIRLCENGSEMRRINTVGEFGALCNE